MTILFVRRRNLGRGSILGMKRAMTIPTCTLKTWTGKLYGTNTQTPFTHVVRWGCTATIPYSGHGSVALNKPSAIHLVNDKKKFRLRLMDSAPHSITTTLTADVGQPDFPMVVRTATHSRGRNLWVVNTVEELLNVTVPLGDEWYATKLIDKIAEYRVYVVNGRVVTVANKTPDDPTQVAWNVAQGGRFDVVRWGDWPLEVCRVAIEAFRHSGLDFGGVDVMVCRQTNRPYVLEINSAPSLPFLSDGSVSYRQKSMAKAFQYIYENSNDWIEPEGYESWKQLIHPAINNQE